MTSNFHWWFGIRQINPPPPTKPELRGPFKSNEDAKVAREKEKAGFSLEVSPPFAAATKEEAKAKLKIFLP